MSDDVARRGVKNNASRLDLVDSYIRVLDEQIRALRAAYEALEDECDRQAAEHSC